MDDANCPPKEIVLLVYTETCTYVYITEVILLFQLYYQLSWSITMYFEGLVNLLVYTEDFNNNGRIKRALTKYEVQFQL